jgi:Domain of unknown function (DUF4375)
MTKSDTRSAAPDEATLGSLKSGELLSRAIAPIWNVVSIYDDPDIFQLAFASVSEAQGLLLAAHWCQSEVCNGGFHQFFTNHTGVLAPEAARGFEFLLLPQAAALVSRCIQMIGDPYPRDRAMRIGAVKKLERPGNSRSEWDPFSPMDDAFYRVAGTATFDEQADGFVRSNIDLFFRRSVAIPRTEWSP